MSDGPEMSPEDTPHLIRLNPQQYEAVTTVDGPLLILAGAGSGKTRVLTRRIAHLLHLGVEPKNIFAVTFTNKAAAEMKERVVELVGEIGRKVWCSTFHSSCCRILRMEAETLGYTRTFAIYDDDDQHRLIKAIISDFGYDPKVVTPRWILGRIDHYKNRMISVDDLVKQRRAHGHDPVIRIWRDYESALRASDALDFNDLIGKTVTLLAEYPDTLQRYREQFKYIMVDEYQDTNNAQYRLLKMLAKEHQNLAAVGDDDQSIYGFRGADISNILNFREDFPAAKIIRMEQNYRSTANILQLANAVVEKNTGRIEKKLWTDTPGGPKVSFFTYASPKDEAKGVAELVKSLKVRGASFDDFAVIYRTNATSQPFEAAFRAASIPHKVVGGRKFYTRREIRDVLGFLRLITNPADDAAFLRVVNVPPRGIGTTSVSKLREESASRGDPLLKTARSIARGQSRMARALAGFVAMMDAFTSAAMRDAPAALLGRVYDRTGYVTMLEEEDSSDARNRLMHLAQLHRDAAGFVPETPARSTSELLQLWLDRIALAGSDEELPDDGEVTLMTVHNSKGLEYPIVFVVHMTEGQFPHTRATEEEGGVDEERRLAYVAFTRAQQRLVVTRSRAKVNMGERARGTLSPVAPSRFLYGIPLEICDGDPPAPESDADDTELEEVVRTKLSAFRRHRVAAPVPLQPVGDALPEHCTTREIESIEQLQPGVRLHHPRLGVGEIVRVSRTVRPPMVVLRFGEVHRTMSLASAHLELVID